MIQVSLTLTPKEASHPQSIQKAVARELQLPSDVCYYRIVKRSVDARQRQIKVLLTLQVFTQEEDSQRAQYEPPHYQDVRQAAKQVLIVGAGPAGLFAALTLLERGIRPIIIERGKEVSARKVDIAALNKNEGIDAESNYCFGEGGAGTFSDGKLFSRSKKRGNMQRVMEIFHYHGADDSILYEAHAHIGSDKLPAIIRHMRQTIIDCGGEIHFGEKMVGLQHDADGGCVVQTEQHTYQGEAIILCIGHSAHDTYRLLASSGLRLEAKGFALGVRAEHPQAVIDDIMYHGSPLRREGLLPAASYSLVTQVKNEYGQRGVYSFCMCPGGHIVPAGSTAESGVVNGMSASHRNSPFANSGMVVELHPEDMIRPTTDPCSTQAALECLAWQEQVEHQSWLHGAQAAQRPHSAIAPAQRMSDFVEGRASADLPPTSYLPGCITSRLDQWLPPVVAKALQQGFKDFQRKYPGFLCKQAVILGVESRSSSPVRIPRDPQTLQHPDFHGLYPAGEGAGYAGGITSSAMDGIHAAMRI